jgi:anti-sigma B factor antagonist
MDKEFNFEIRFSDEFKTVITVTGFLNSNSKDEFSDKLLEYKEKSKNYIFEISELEYISSSGVGFFMELYEIIKEKGGDICFVGMSNVVRRVFDYMGFLSFFGDKKTLSEAENFIK